MSGAGQLRTRITVEREVRAPDGMGGASVTRGAVYYVAGQFVPERGRERLEAGRLEAALGGIVRIRSSSETRTITEADTNVINGQRFQIRSISNPDQRNKYLELTVEKGVAL